MYIFDAIVTDGCSIWLYFSAYMDTSCYNIVKTENYQLETATTAVVMLQQNYINILTF